MTNKFLLGLVAALVVGGVVGYFLHTSPAPTQQVVGANPSNEQYNPVVFYNTVTERNQVFGNINSSSSTPTTTLPSLTNVGHLTIAAGQTQQNASTTAIDANSIVTVQLEQTTPIAGVTCNTTISASSSEATTVFASTTNISLNGFAIKVASTPVTNPFCFAFKIAN